MQGITLIGIMTFINFVLLLVMCYMMFKENRTQHSVPAAPANNFQTILSDLKESEPEAAAEDFTKMIMGSPVKEEPVLDQKKTALQRLKTGENPEKVASDLGFSRSEIGLLRATAMRD